MSLALADEITEEALAKCRSRGPNDESRDCHYRHPGLRVHLRPMRSVVAQVFGRRDADTIHALLQPASKKRTAQLRAQTSELDPNPDIGRTTTRSPVRRP